MAAGSGTVTVKILGDASSLKGALSESDTALGRFHDKASAVGGKMMDVGTKLTLGITTPILGIGALAFDAASDLNESLSKVDVVFGDNADAIKQWSQNAATSLGMSKQAALEAAGTFGNFLESMGLGVPAAADMSQKLVGLASDLASFNNANPEDVLLALRSGLAGEAEPMRKYGVALSETAVKAKALEMGLGDAHGELTEGEKIQARYAIVMEQTKLAQGDFARTADGAANKQRTLKAEMENMAASIGQKLMPIGMKLLEWVGKLADWWGQLDPQMQNIVLIIAAVAAAIGPVVGVIGALVTAIAAVISPVGLVVVAIAALVAGFIYAYTHFEGFRNVVDSVASFLVEVAWPAIQTFFGFVIDINEKFYGFFIDHWGQIQGFFQAAWDAMAAVWNTVGAPIFTAIQVAAQFVIDWFQTTWTVLSSVWQSVWDVVSVAWQTVGKPVFWLIVGAGQTVIDWFTSTWSTLGDLFGKVWDVVSSVWDTVGKPVFEAIKRIVEAIIGAIEKAIDLFNQARDLTGAGSAAGSLGKFADPTTGRIAQPGGGGTAVSGQRASGGPVGPYGAYVVGERGPEILQMGSRGGYVHPNVAGMMGGETHVHVHIGQVIGNDLREAARQLAQPIRRELLKHSGRNPAGVEGLL